MLLFLSHHFALKNDQITVSRRSHPWNGMFLKERQLLQSVKARDQIQLHCTSQFTICWCSFQQRLGKCSLAADLQNVLAN